MPMCVRKNHHKQMTYSLDLGHYKYSAKESTEESQTMMSSLYFRHKKNWCQRI
jgi:hypothetical protein